MDATASKESLAIDNELISKIDRALVRIGGCQKNSTSIKCTKIPDIDPAVRTQTVLTLKTDPFTLSETTRQRRIITIENDDPKTNRLSKINRMPNSAAIRDELQILDVESPIDAGSEESIKPIEEQPSPTKKRSVVRKPPKKVDKAKLVRTFPLTRNPHPQQVITVEQDTEKTIQLLLENNPVIAAHAKRKKFQDVDSQDYTNTIDLRGPPPQVLKALQDIIKDIGVTESSLNNPIREMNETTPTEKKEVKKSLSNKAVTVAAPSRNLINGKTFNKVHPSIHSNHSKSLKTVKVVNLEHSDNGANVCKTTNSYQKPGVTIVTKPEVVNETELKVADKVPSKNSKKPILKKPSGKDIVVIQNTLASHQKPFPKRNFDKGLINYGGIRARHGLKPYDKNEKKEKNMKNLIVLNRNDSDKCITTDNPISDNSTETEQSLTVDKAIDARIFKKYPDYRNNECQTHTTFEDLMVPDVKLTKENLAEDISIDSKLPILPTLINEPEPSAKTEHLDVKAMHSFIVGRATVTYYTTKQKIDFLVGSDKDIYCDLKPHPENVVSVLKKEMRRKKEKTVRKDCGDTEPINYFKQSKLIKPSDLISAISVNDDSFTDGLSEQFQKELNFIDSFFESLQYLESCTLSDSYQKSSLRTSFDDWVDKDEIEDNTKLLSELELSSGTQTIASKSLCLLNLLIRDEQRRAKNLLFVLKMREDALTDFTRSQILWLENKKKLDNKDVSTLKKKQRGALLKLQHECGEMQRMRKALLTLSEKRKAALMKTKKNIELKLADSMDVEKILSSGKKKLRRTSSLDRSILPLKCFELSVSSCDESQSKERPATSAEKSIQTSDSVLGTLLVDRATDVAAENFIVVDGDYLNILFNNLAMPKIFSSGKQYEVNEEALKNILNSVNALMNTPDDNVVEKFMESFKTDVSTPSTARSLVEEFDQYYKNLGEYDESKDYSSPERDDDDLSVHSPMQEDVERIDNSDDILIRSESVEVCLCENNLSQPAGNGQFGVEDTSVKFTSSTFPQDNNVITSVPQTSVPAPTLLEAEELRRQQLAIEQEIKALEQQQNQLIVVREIPDKPPPPYTPPVDALKRFAHENLVERVRCHLEQDIHTDDPLDNFISDFCKESLERHRRDISEKPWDAYSLVPRREATEPTYKSIAGDLVQVLSSAPTSRRADHVEDILFAEWLRCEAEWTSLHVDEASVKNQLFASVFRKILDESIDDYKGTVLN